MIEWVKIFKVHMGRSHGICPKYRGIVLQKSGADTGEYGGRSHRRKGIDNR